MEPGLLMKSQLHLPMKANSLVIMAGGASSRMKRSLVNIPLNDQTRRIAEKAHKSLIPLGKDKTPLLIQLIRNAQKAGYQKIYLITAPENSSFKTILAGYPNLFSISDFELHYAIQAVPKERTKPLGTADAVLQAMKQYPVLQEQSFTLCNGDNLYSTKSLALLLQAFPAAHAIISYTLSGLQFSEERIARFALLKHDSDGYLKGIVEKPTPTERKTFADPEGEVFVSMNLFRFSGKLIQPYLENCPIHPKRLEKEIPVALSKLVDEQPQSVWAIKISENVPDLTSADDIIRFE